MTNTSLVNELCDVIEWTFDEANEWIDCYVTEYTACEVSDAWNGEGWYTINATDTPAWYESPDELALDAYTKTISDDTAQALVSVAYIEGADSTDALHVIYRGDGEDPELY